MEADSDSLSEVEITPYSKKTVARLTGTWEGSMFTAIKTTKREDPNVKQVKVRGEPHKSTKDPEDPTHVLSLELKDHNGNRLRSVHVKEDGTIKLKSSKQKKSS